VIGAMFLHNAIIWRSKAAARRDAEPVHDADDARNSAGSI
jgi:hypothetical protein